MKLSARNKLKGKIVEVKKGATTTHVKIDIGGAVVKSSITNEAADELKLAAGRLCRHQGQRRHGRRRLGSLPAAAPVPALVVGIRYILENITDRTYQGIEDRSRKSCAIVRAGL